VSQQSQHPKLRRSNHASALLSKGLGSSSFLTDISGYATQHLQYTRAELGKRVPFGEDFIHEQNTTSYYTPYTFSGKERDMETGLSYFGARYGVYPERRRSRRDAGLSIWLSADPRSDKYPHQSPYAYCSNNPIMLFDPDGKEDYEVNRRVNIKSVMDSEGKPRGLGQPDRLIAGKARYDKEGNLKNKDKNVLTLKSNLIQSKEVGNNVEKGGYAFTSFSTTENFGEQGSLFIFLADNTDVEWSLLSITNKPGSCDINEMFVSTSHNSGKEKHGYYLAEGSKRVVEFGHSHPRRGWYDGEGLKFSTSQPSENDHTNLKPSITNRSPNAELWIYRYGKTREY